MITRVSDTPAAVAPADRGTIFHVLMVGLAVSAWVTLWFWSNSPYGRYLDHGRWTDIRIAAVICRAIPAGDVVVDPVRLDGGVIPLSDAPGLGATIDPDALTRYRVKR